MSYVAEPYAQFVDDLLTGLTGGTVRQRFEFRVDDNPFPLDARGPILPGTLRVFGQAAVSFQSFQAGRDFELIQGPSIHWLAGPNGQPAAEAIWPDEGTAFFVNFEVSSPGRRLALTDRNVGSVTRLLAESFGREFAVLSRQLERVYQAGFLETASGADLDALTRLVGVRRRTSARARGTVVFARRSPAPADVTIPLGTRVSADDPPPVTFETTEERVLRRGTLSVEVPVEALDEGSLGAVAARRVTVIHRPVLGVETVTNPAAIVLDSRAEGDDVLRSRARVALEGAGRATHGALVSALTDLPELDAKDIRLSEDHLAHPGLVKLAVVFPEGGTEEEKQRRVALSLEAIEETRPVGVRVEPNFQHAQPVTVESLPVPGELRDDDTAAPAAVAPLFAPDAPFFPVGVRCVVVPDNASLTPEERFDLSQSARELVQEFFTDLGIGDFVVYNRLVARLMSLEGVLDVDLELSVEGASSDPRSQTLARRTLLSSDPNLRPVLAALDVQVGGQLVLLNVSVAVELIGAGAVGDAAANRQTARVEIADRLRQRLSTLTDAELTPAVLKRLLGTSENYVITRSHYEVNYLEAGVRIRAQDPVLPLTGLERLWVGEVRLLDGGQA